MVHTRPSTARSRLHESLSAFVPLFLSSRSASGVPPVRKSVDIEDKFEYTGSATPRPVVSGEHSDLYAPASDGHSRYTLPVTGQNNHSMNPLPLSRTQTSSSLKSSSSASKPSRTRRPQHTRTRSRPSPSRTTTSSSTHTKSRNTRTRPRRKVTAFTRLRLAVESKFRLTLAFGLGFISALVIYLGLLLSHTSSGTTFHVLSILLLISLMAVFAHSLLRFLSLNTELKAARVHRAGLKKTPSARGWNISRPLPQFTSSSTTIHDEKFNSTNPGIGTANGGYENDDFPVFNAAAAATNYNADYEHNPYGHDIEATAGAHDPAPVRYPPPVYGNTRNSVRLSISPPASHYGASHQPINADPNITSPTPMLAPGMPGWHPASFRSEGGITAVLERRRVEVKERLQAGGGGGEVLGKARYEPRLRGREGGGMI